MPTLPTVAKLGRRHCIPIIYTRGTHYDVGFDVNLESYLNTNCKKTCVKYNIEKNLTDNERREIIRHIVKYMVNTYGPYPKRSEIIEVAEASSNIFNIYKVENNSVPYGRTFAAMIHNFLAIFEPLNNEFLPAYSTPAGRETYDQTLASMQRRFPQYVDELRGTADGSGVPFHKLFLLHMDNIILNATSNKSVNGGASGCSTICVNQYNEEILGHTEDARFEVLNHFYFVSAHIITDEPRGQWGVKEERFTSLCYAGYLPGYTMNYNHHGLVFSINTLSADRLYAAKTPRYFITRALLTAENFEQAIRILRDSGCGAADGCSINMTFLRQEGDRLFHNAEMAPAEPGTFESQLNVLTASPGENMIHCNRYLRLSISEADLEMIQSSECRMKALKDHKQAHCRKDVINMLGDQTGTQFRVFQEFGEDDIIKTVAVGIFDCVERTWSIYADNPKTSEPLVVLPLILKNNSYCEN